jgi:hypothetical protein
MKTFQLEIEITPAHATLICLPLFFIILIPSF